MGRPRDTDGDWEALGREMPYWGVLTADKFKGELTPERRAEFFRTGEVYVERLLAHLRERLDPGFAPARALDFGCGVGRIALALAPRVSSVVGVDVSESMLAECRRNADEGGVENLELVRSDDELSQVTGRFDLVHSYITLQHIPADRGQALVARLAALVAEDGIGALHVTYAKAPDRRPHHAAAAPKRHRRSLSERILGHKPLEERMRMNAYDLNAVFRSLQEAGFQRIDVEGTDHGFYGLMLCFQRPEGAPTSSF